jgi:hypothetical protein
MESVRRGGLTRVAVAAALLLVGLGSLGLWRVLSGSEDLPFSEGASAPTSVHLTKDKDYTLAVPGGVNAMIARGVPVASSNNGQTLGLQCDWSRAGDTDTESLSISAESTWTKAENTVGRFTAPATGQIHIDCDNWGTMFVPDADDRSADSSGWALLVAMITLTIGAGLGLSEMRLTWERGQASRTAGEDDEVERFVDVTQFRRDDREVRGPDRTDRTP